MKNKRVKIFTKKNILIYYIGQLIFFGLIFLCCYCFGQNPRHDTIFVTSKKDVRYVKYMDSLNSFLYGNDRRPLYVQISENIKKLAELGYDDNKFSAWSNGAFTEDDYKENPKMRLVKKELVYKARGKDAICLYYWINPTNPNVTHYACGIFIKPKQIVSYRPIKVSPKATIIIPPKPKVIDYTSYTTWMERGVIVRQVAWHKKLTK